MPSEAIRVVIVEDDRTTRQGLAFLIGATPGFVCSADYRSVNEALNVDLDPPPHVILLDIHMPGIPGSEGVKLFQVHLLHAWFLTKYPGCCGIERFLFPDEAAGKRIAIFEWFCETPDQEKVE